MKCRSGKYVTIARIALYNVQTLYYSTMYHYYYIIVIIIIGQFNVEWNSTQFAFEALNDKIIEHSGVRSIDAMHRLRMRLTLLLSN